MSSKTSDLASGAPLLRTDEVALARSGTDVKGALGDIVFSGNGIINGCFDFASYATSYALTTSFAYGCVDRWTMKQATSAQCTASQAAPSPALAGFKNCLKLLLTGTSTGKIEVVQALETLNAYRFQGKKVKVRVRAVKGSTWNPTSLVLTIYTGTGTDQSAATVASWTGTANTANSIAPTTGWVTYTYDVDIPSTATQIGYHLAATPTGAAVDANSYLMITDIDLDDGKGEMSRRSYPEERRLCETYRQLVGNGAAGGWHSATQAAVGSVFRTAMRTAPTMALVSSTPVIAEVGTNIRTGSASTTGSYNTAPTATGWVQLVAGFTGATAGNPALMDGDYLSASAEL